MARKRAGRLIGDTDMTLAEIFSTYTAGSTGFCIAVETHCGFNISRTEIARIAERAAEDGPNSDDMAARFQWEWENTADWAD
jgi:hypothetical protein